MTTFDDLYKLSSKGRHREVLDILISPSGRVRRPYSLDLNHAWYVAGDELYSLGDIKRAMMAFKKALAHSRGDVAAMMAIANCYSDLGNPRMAAFYLLKALSVDNKNNDLKYNLGNAYFDLGEYEKAIAEYSQVESGRIARLARKNARRAVQKKKDNM